MEITAPACRLIERRSRLPSDFLDGSGPMERFFSIPLFFVAAHLRRSTHMARI